MKQNKKISFVLALTMVVGLLFTNQNRVSGAHVEVEEWLKKLGF